MLAPVVAGDPAIRAVSLGKRYELYPRPQLRLLQTLFRGRRQFYREFWALRDVTFDVARGETVGVIGRNGSGKSTLLQLIAGTLRPTTGSVEVRGRVVALLELGSGFNPEFTGRENVFLYGAILGMSRAELKANIAAIAEFAGLGNFIDEPIKTYSSGMVVRLAFAVAVHATPDVLIIDEVLAVGDTAFQARCLHRIRELQKAQVAILLVSHSANVVIEFCARVVYLDAGQVAAIGPCRDMLENYANDTVTGQGGIALAAPPSKSSVAAVESDEGNAQPASRIVAVAISNAADIVKACFSYGDEIHVVVDVLYREANAAPCLGVQLRSVDSIVLWTITTEAMNLDLSPAPAGARRRYRWRLRAQFGGARYVVSIGVGDVTQGRYQRHSRLHYAGHFDVLPRTGVSGGWIEPLADFVDEQTLET